MPGILTSDPGKMPGILYLRRREEEYQASCLMGPPATRAMQDAWDPHLHARQDAWDPHLRSREEEYQASCLMGPPATRARQDAWDPLPPPQGRGISGILPDGSASYTRQARCLGSSPPIQAGCLGFSPIRQALCPGMPRIRTFPPPRSH